jgi:hypothetical protein
VSPAQLFVLNSRPRRATEKVLERGFGPLASYSVLVEGNHFAIVDPNKGSHVSSSQNLSGFHASQHPHSPNNFVRSLR